MTESQGTWENDSIDCFFVVHVLSVGNPRAVPHRGAAVHGVELDEGIKEMGAGDEQRTMSVLCVFPCL